MFTKYYEDSNISDNANIYTKLFFEWLDVLSDDQDICLNVNEQNIATNIIAFQHPRKQNHTGNSNEQLT